MRILGLDIGSRSIKAVELDSAFGRFEVRDYHELPVAAGTDPSVAVDQLLKGLPKKPDRVAVALRCSTVTFRNLTLSTRGKKAIQATVGYEIEDELPFSAESAVHDYTILSQTKNSTNVHVAATLKKQVVAQLDQWLGSGVDPDLVTTEAWAYRTLFSRIVPVNEKESPMLFIHVGHERTILYIHWNGMPVVCREIAWGGRNLTLAICKRYNIPMDQAEQAKLDNGFVIPPGKEQETTPEQREFSQTLAVPLQELLRELQQVVLTCKNVTKQNLLAAYISGGTSLLPGLGRFIEESLQIPVRPLQALASVSGSGVTYSEQTESAFALPLALGLCQVGPDRATTINFRKGEFAKLSRPREFDVANIRRVLMAAGAIATCLLASLVVQNLVFKSRIADVDRQLNTNIRDFFGSQVSPSAVKTYLTNPKTLKDAVNKQLNEQRDLQRLLGPNPHSPIDFLKSISSTIPKDLVVDLLKFQAGTAPTNPYSATAETTASLTLTVANPQVAERIAGLLGSRLSGIQRGKMDEVTASDGSKKWKITFSGKPTEDTYGK